MHFTSIANGMQFLIYGNSDDRPCDLEIGNGREPAYIKAKNRFHEEANRV